MHSYYVPVIVSLTFGGMAAAQPAKDAAPKEIWETVFARDREGRDQQIGYSHLLFETVKEGDQTLTRGTRELRIHIKRDGQLAQLKADTGTEETADGKVVGVFMRHWIG